MSASALTSLVTPANEAQRLAAVRRYDVLDTPPDGSFDRITALAAKLFNVPIALVTIVDEDRIWFKSRYGLDDVAQLDRDPGLCASAICQDAAYVVEHADTDPRTLANPLVAGEFGLRFYASAPLKTHDGFNLGTLCIIDREPRTLTAEQAAMLTMLADVVIDELELRLSALSAVASERRLYRREHRIAATLQQAMLPQGFPALDNVRFDAMYRPAAGESGVGGDWYDAFALDDRHLLISIGDVAGHGVHAAVLMGKLRQSLRALALNETSPYTLLECLNATLLKEDPDTIVTAFVGILNTRSGKFEYANAGHPAPVLTTQKGLRELASGGLPLGLRSPREPAARRVRLEPGSLLVLYTDGLSEAERDPIEGERLIRDALAGAPVRDASHPARALADAVLTRGTPDDVAVLTVQFLRRGGRSERTGKPRRGREANAHAID